MYSRNETKKSTESSSIERLREALDTADAVLIGAGAGLSTSAGLTYSGERFERYFSDFYRKYGISDRYSGGFYPFATLEEYWAWWSRHIFYNRYVDAPLPVYQELLASHRVPFVTQQKRDTLTANESSAVICSVPYLDTSFFHSDIDFLYKFWCS